MSLIARTASPSATPISVDILHVFNVPAHRYGFAQDMQRISRRKVWFGVSGALATFRNTTNSRKERSHQLQTQQARKGSQRADLLP
jgi:hypothetical protein